MSSKRFSLLAFCSVSWTAALWVQSLVCLQSAEAFNPLQFDAGKLFHWFMQGEKVASQLVSQLRAVFNNDSTLRISALASSQIIHDAEDVLVGFSKYLWATGMSSQCSKAIRHTIKSAFRLEPWSLALVDSLGKIPSGILMGGSSMMGDYEECLQVYTDIDKEMSPFRNNSVPYMSGRYCSVKGVMDGEYWLRRYTNRSSSMSNATRAIIEYALQDEVELIYEVTRMIDELPGFIGLCFPSPCSRKDVSKLFSFLTPVLRAFLAVSVNFTVGSCDTQEDITNRPMPDKAIMFLGLLLVLCCICALGTISEYMSTKKDSRVTCILQCFSVRTNYASLWREETCPLRQMLHGLRGMAVVWFITGNFVYLHSVMLTKNMLILKDMIKDVAITFALNYSLSEDTIIFVVAVFFAFAMERRGASICSAVYCCLYMALHMLPLVAFCMGFIVFLLPELGQGPSWSFEMSRFTKNCSENWWKNLLMINNFVPRKQQCIEQLWFPSFLVQCSFIGAMLVYLLIARPTLGRLSILLVVVATALVTATITLMFDSGPTLLLREYSAGTRHVYFDEVYTKVYTRGGVFFLGIYAGVFLSKYKTLTISKCDNAIGWLLTTLTSMILIHSTYYWNRGLRLPTSMEAAIFAALHRLVWCAPLLFMCLSCALGYARLTLWMFSWRIWTLFSRLTYCILLSHAYVILYSNGVARSPFFFSYDYLFYLALHHAVFAVFVSIILSLLVERPVMELLKLCGPRIPQDNSVSLGLDAPQPKPTLEPILIVARNSKGHGGDSINNKETSFELK